MADAIEGGNPEERLTIIAKRVLGLADGMSGSAARYFSFPVKGLGDHPGVKDACLWVELAVKCAAPSGMAGTDDQADQANVPVRGGTLVLYAFVSRNVSSGDMLSMKL